MDVLLSPIDSASAPASTPQGHWLQVISHLQPSRGGMSAVVPRLASEVAKASNLSFEMSVFQSSNEEIYASDHFVSSVWPTSRAEWFRNGTLTQDFERVLRSADGLHIHGLWETSTNVAARAAHRAGKPYVLSAHGMLDSWALRNKATKKRIYATLFERTNIQSATCLHALTSAEADDYRRFGITAPIAVIPNGVDAPPATTSSLFFEKFPQLSGRKILLFLGRIHFKKGLDLLIPAWNQIAKFHADTTLVLAGPDSENSLQAVARLTEKAGLSNRVLFTGMLEEPLKWSALAAASCFVLPSYSEGLSVAVLEAMSMGVPSVVSEQCHIAEIALFGAGRVVETLVSPLAEAIHDVLSADASSLARMGARGRELVQREYSWEVVAKQMKELYEWVGSGGPRPTLSEIQEVRQ